MAEEQVDNVQLLVDFFKTMDKDNRGAITMPEFRHLLTQIGDKMDEEVLNELVRTADADRDSSVNFDELVRALEKEEPVAALGDTGVKKIKAGAAYVSSQQRELRD